MVKKNRTRVTPTAESLRADMQAVEDPQTGIRESSASGQETPGQLSDAAKHNIPVRVPVVGIGASAGGLDAFREFLTAMPEDSGLAIVLVPHLDPSHKSMMVDLLARQTKIRVCEAEDKMPVQANQIYVIPPNELLSIKDAVLHLSQVPDTRRSETAIDTFLISLARDQQ